MRSQMIFNVRIHDYENCRPWESSRTVHVYALICICLSFDNENISHVFANHVISVLHN